MLAAILAGTILGFLTGLGVGGGSLLILWLTLVMHMEPEAARSINLLFFLPSALISSLFRWRQGSIDKGAALPAVLSGCATAAAVSLLSAGMDTSLLKKLFGILLILTGFRELFYKAK